MEHERNEKKDDELCCCFKSDNVALLDVLDEMPKFLIKYVINYINRFEYKHK